MTLAPIACLLCALPSPPEGSLHGRITDAQSRTPVVAAAVYVTGTAIGRYTLTNEAGEYTFQSLPAGKYQIRVTHPGFEPMGIEVDLGSGPGIELDVPLRLQPVRGRPLYVVAQRATVVGTDERGADLSSLAASQRWLGAGPHSASALSDMVAAQTAVRPDPDGREARHVLYIWGTNTEQGRVLLDGAALGAPLHLGGLLSPIDPELLATAEYQTGGASPRLDGGTTHVMEFRTRSAGERTRAWGELDALATRAGIEAPLAGGGVLAAARRVNSEVIEWIAGRPLDYGYADVLGRVDLVSSTRDRVWATALLTDESITIPRDQAEDRASWQNRAFSAAWVRSGDAADLTVGLTHSGASADLPYLRAAAAHLVSDVDRTALTVARRTSGVRSSGIGLDIERLQFGRRARGFASSTQLAASGCAADATCLDTGLLLVAGWGEFAWQPRPGWRAAGGLRVSLDADRGTLELLPRASVTAIVDEATAITLSAGRFSRAAVRDAHATNPIVSDPDAEGSPVALSPETLVATASHVQLSIARRTARTSAGAGFILRHHEGAAGLPARTVPGVDVWWLHVSGPFDASVGYSYLQRGEPGSAEARPRDRHVLAASVAGAQGPARLQLSAAWAVGLPFVSLALDDPRAEPVTAGLDATAQVPPTAAPAGRYLRIDATATATWRVNWLDRETAVTPYIKLINALGRQDALFFFREADSGGQLRALAAVPLVPTLGIRWSF